MCAPAVQNYVAIKAEAILRVLMEVRTSLNSIPAMHHLPTREVEMVSEKVWGTVEEAVLILTKKLEDKQPTTR